TQRSSLDRFAGIDHTPLRDARARLAAIDASLGDLGGDDRARARELDLLRFQVAELDGAAVQDPDEDARLQAEEEVLADAAALGLAAAAAHDALAGDGGAADGMAAALSQLVGRTALGDIEAR